jgi:hypothetical protein
MVVESKMMKQTEAQLRVIEIIDSRLPLYAGWVEHDCCYKKKLRIQLCNQLGEESMIDPHNFH